MIAPTFRNWMPPALPFSWRSVLAREFHTLFLISVVFFISELLEGVLIKDSTAEAWIAHEPQWFALVIASAAVYVVVRTLKKTTSWLNVADR